MQVALPRPAMPCPGSRECRLRVGRQAPSPWAPPMHHAAWDHAPLLHCQARPGLALPCTVMYRTRVCDVLYNTLSTSAHASEAVQHTKRTGHGQKSGRSAALR